MRCILLCAAVLLVSCGESKKGPSASSQPIEPPTSAATNEPAKPAAITAAMDKPHGKPVREVSQERADALAEKVAALTALTSAKDIVAGYSEEAATVCACETVDCMYGLMEKQKALTAAYRKLPIAEQNKFQMVVEEHSNQTFGCLEKARKSEAEAEKTITPAGERYLELFSKYADEVCACRDMACAKNSTNTLESATADLELKTAADTMNEKLRAQQTRALECQGKLLHKR